MALTMKWANPKQENMKTQPLVRCSFVPAGGLRWSHNDEVPVLAFPERTDGKMGSEHPVQSSL